MQYLQRSTKQEVLQLQGNWQSYFTLCVEKKPSLKNSWMQQLSTYSKGKNPQVCDNHRGISLLSIAGKILARVLLNRLNEHLERSGLLPESQCGFRKNRGTTDMIFTARQLQEKCQEQNVDLYMTFVDLTKAFDTVNREGLWKIMAKFGCHAKFIAMVRQFHDGMLARVQTDGEFSDPFPVTNGGKQGCVLASTLFSMMFPDMLTDAVQDGDNGIPIRYRFDGKLFNLRRLQAKSKVQTEVLDEFLGRCWKPRPPASVFNTSLGTWRMLMHEKPCLIPILKGGLSGGVLFRIRRPPGLVLVTGVYF